MTAVLFGSISTIADTSELQREAFNEAFRTHGLPWRWERAEYLGLLEQSGGEDRIAAYAAREQEAVDAAAVHRTKSEAFRRLLAAGVRPRPGVAELVAEARGGGLKVGLVTTTSRENVTALIDALGPAVRAADFEVTVSAEDVERPKPDAAAYAFALERLGEAPEDCVAVEDNLDGVAAAQAAGLACVAFPNANTAGHDFTAAEHRVDRLGLAELRTFIPNA